VADTAAILFTSGSEALPKTVPLSHGNLLANVRAVTAAYALRRDDRLLGILPPFHSFGLTVTTLLPLVSGLRAAYHANPTEGAAVARLCGAWRVTLLAGTPTFLGAAARAGSDEELSSLRLVITGAEKCPDRLHDYLASRFPRLSVLEGYGVTECSPVVCANREEDPRRGTIGVPLPGVEVALAHPDTGKGVGTGEAGVLLVRGESVFSGYLGEGAPDPFQQFEGVRWYRTGDLVRRGPGGHLVFAGRLRRFVKIGGEMVSLPAVEEVLLERFGGEGEDGAPPALAVGAAPSGEPPELVLFSAGGIGREEANEAIRAGGLSPLHFVRRVVEVPEIPLLGTGKTDYRALEALLGGRTGGPEPLYSGERAG
jgi:long-chain-fatty-acid--[acyl-carrier-protein] ligase